MPKWIFSIVMLASLLMSIFTLSSHVASFEASGTIYIRADGSIDPPTAPISTTDNITYTLTDDIYNSGFWGAIIEIQRGNTIIDGAGHTLQGHEESVCQGIALSGRSNVTIRNFEIHRFYDGILLSSSSNIIICHNRMTNISSFAVGLDPSCSNNSIYRNNITSANGIRLYSSCDYNSIFANNITGTGSWCGIEIDSSSNTSIYENNIADCHYGICLYSSSNNSIYDNNITAIEFFGIWFYSFCERNRIFGNNITNNGDGIRLFSSSNYNKIFGNKITNNNWNGIFLEESSNYNTISENNLENSTAGIGLHASSNNHINGKNTISKNDYGIVLGISSDCNEILGNNITNNNKGVSLGSSSNNIFYHNNFINNSQQVNIHTSGYSNHWDNGYPSGGNYWSDYVGVDLYKGLYQNETGNDGIGDTPYTINVDNTDHYPILHPWSAFPVHNLNTGLGYATIQAAINAPETLEDHTIFVENGIYYEVVTINKNNLTLVGESSKETIIDGNGIRITSNCVTVTGFTIRNTQGTGLSLDGSNDSVISGNNVTNNDGGGILFVHGSSNNTINGNNISHNRWDGGVGISLLGSSGLGNVIIGNNIIDNDCGISVSCSGTIIAGNNMTANSAYGVGLWAGANNSVTENRIESNNGYGIGLSTSWNVISRNNISMSTLCLGIWCFSGSSSNVINGNTISNCQKGIDFWGSNSNSIYGNTIENNSLGIGYKESNYNVFYHNNFINNARQIFPAELLNNTWDDGYPSGGNYWSDYVGTDLYSGSYQNETGSDGIGDIPYVIDENNQDNYPLTQPWPFDAMPPDIVVLSPQNTTYCSNSVPITLLINEQTSWIGYSLDCQPNVTISGNSIVDVEDGSHQIVIYANDTSGNIGSSEIVYFSVNSLFYDPWKTSFIGLGGYPIVDFAVYSEELYAAADNMLYVNDGSSWSIIDTPTFVVSLEPYEGKLYVGGQGGLYSYDGTTFNLIFTVPTYIKVLGVYDNTLYAGTVLANPPTLYYCSGSAETPANWHVDSGFSAILNFSGPFSSIDSFEEYANNVYVTSGGTLYCYNETGWSIVKTYDDVYAFLDMQVYNGSLYFATRDQGWRKPMYQGGTGFSGRVIEYDGENWTTILDHDYWIFALEAYDNKLYAGTANKILSYNETSWDTSFNAVEGAYYAISFTTYNGKIYVGMGNGYIFADPATETTSIETPVVPEFPSSFVLPLLIIATLLATILSERKRTFRQPED